jgi:hypothetical protein
VLIFFLLEPDPFFRPTFSKKLENVEALDPPASRALLGGDPPKLCPLNPLLMLSARLCSPGLKVPWLHGPACGELETNSNGFFNSAVVSDATLLPKSLIPTPCVLPSPSSSSRSSGSVFGWVGYVFGEVFELLAAVSRPKPSLISSGEPTIWASRKLLGTWGAWCPGFIEDVRECLVEGGVDGRFEDMVNEVRQGPYLHECCKYMCAWNVARSNWES